MISYSSIGGTIHHVSRIAEMSSRNKVSLLMDLMTQLGIMERLQREGSGKFDTIWEEQTEKAWKEA